MRSFGVLGEHVEEAQVAKERNALEREREVLERFWKDGCLERGATGRNTLGPAKLGDPQLRCQHGDLVEG